MKIILSERKPNQDEHPCACPSLSHLDLLSCMCSSAVHTQLAAQLTVAEIVHSKMQREILLTLAEVQHILKDLVNAFI